MAVPAGRKLLAFFDVSPAYKRVKHLLREAAERHAIDYELLQAVVATESGFDGGVVSPKGAIGLMQVMPATAQRWGVYSDRAASVEKKLADPGTNIGAGARYLRHLLDLFPGCIELALAAYNAGEGAVQRAGNRVPDYRETQNYVKTVLQLYDQLKPPLGATRPRAAAASRVRVELDGPAADVAPAPAYPIERD
ncbi:lytic transglycosylase domain-containing protein [Xylophilus sp.]|uniref:lytic transglycosylase domain-containing protein n=1 Tax=Xylophilus sp. TaxID=2653893 RepID=UPI0013B74D24|nr:lytic transglycosylase domain-containing protein [Xylophilus sp.]KAF1049126.1 MAG: Soluble lytic murein transglycosylase [Xylophilus sp.]